MTFKNHQKEAEILDLTRGRIEDISPLKLFKEKTEEKSMAIEIKNENERKAREELTLLLQRYPTLSGIEENIWQAFIMMRDSYNKGGKLLLCGNGGSSADTDHIVGELMKAFCSKRPLDPELLSNV